jgi:hypothetical protein
MKPTPIIPAVTMLLTLMACAAPHAPGKMDLSREMQPATDDTPPKGPAGACWARDTIPAVIETVTEQIIATPATTGPDGAAIPATYRTETRQRMVQDRRSVWFQAPCAADMTPEVIATLQRALKARGLYTAPLTGQMDAPTRSALRRFQADRGLDTPTLSLAAARELGIIAADRDTLR